MLRVIAGALDIVRADYRIRKRRYIIERLVTIEREHPAARRTPISMKKLSIVGVAVLGLSGCVAVPYGGGGYYGGGPAYGPAVYVPPVSVGVGYYGGHGYYGGRGRW
jgi:hypothetical protein